MKKMVPIVALLLILFSTPIFAGGKADTSLVGPSTVNVSGTGVVKLTPDTASITFAVETRDAQVAVASQENAKIMTAVNEALLAIGIKKDTIATDNFNVYQESRYNQDTRRTEYLDYKVSNNVTVIVEDVDLVGKVIDTALASGVNRLSNVNFFAKETAKAYDEARRLAVKEAMDTATILAEGTGMELGTVMSISESQGYSGGYGNYAMIKKESVAMDYETPIAPGSTEISVTVHITASLD